MASRVETAFAAVKSQAVSRLPWLKRVRLCHCKAADAEHRRSWRQFMHSCHKDMWTICYARDAEFEMTPLELIGMTSHEFSHIIGEALRFPEHSKMQRGAKTPDAVQLEADWISRNVLGIKIKINRRTLQEAIL
jgi:hypothetical protein